MAAAAEAFDRHRRDRRIPQRWLVSYARALSDYHLQPETKFLGGELRRGSGVLERRHIRAAAVQHIGKEADRWDEQLHTGEDDADVLYGLTPEARAELAATIRAARKMFSVRRFMKASKVSDRTIAAACADVPLGSDTTLVHLAEVSARLLSGYAEQTVEEIDLLEWALEQAAMAGGPYIYAARIGVDGSNLSKALKRKGRKLSSELIERLKGARLAVPSAEG